jgi:DNA replication protein DnaC
MLIHPVVDDLRKLRLEGFVEALETQARNPETKNLLFEERLALLVSHEISLRENRKLQVRLKKAKFRDRASVPDLMYGPERKIDRSLVLSLENCNWIRECKNILITGATGTGKSYLAEALAHAACLKGFSVLRLQIPRILQELSAAKADGSYLKLQAKLARVDVLLIDDFGISPFSDEDRRGFLEIADERYNRKSTILTSQLPIDNWHQVIADTTIGDAILDRLVHNAYRICLEGDSMRKKRSFKQGENHEGT